MKKYTKMIGSLSVNVFLVPLVAMLTWNNIIAWEFNLPTFSYWAFVLIRVAYLFWFNKQKC